MSIERKTLRRALIVVAMGGIVVGGMATLSRPSTAAPLATPTSNERATNERVAQPSFADIFERVSPAVVNISITKKAHVQPMVGMFGGPMTPWGNSPLDEFFGRFFNGPDGPAAGVPTRALGSGLILDSDGYVVTNNHVVDGADSITVTLTDGRELEASLVGTDPKTDLALLKISSDKPLESVQLGDSDAARVGDWVLAIGNPFGLGGTATFGIISAIGRDIQSGPYDDYLQIDAPINSGNSGGPVFDVTGKVIGVNTAIYSPNGGNVGIGFAIPAAQVSKVVAELKEDGRVTRGWLGVQIQEIDKDLAGNMGIDPGTGALVADVVPGSPAAKAHVQVGDVITTFDGSTVDSPRGLSRLVADANPKEKVHLTILRDGKARNLTVRLGEADSSEALAAVGPGDRSNPATADELGMALAPLTDTVRQQLGLPDDVQGLVVTAVKPDSAAGEKGIRRGDVILSVDGRNLETLSDFQAAVGSDESRDRSVRMLVRRGDSQRFVALGLS